MVFVHINARKLLFFFIIRQLIKNKNMGQVGVFCVICRDGNGHKCGKICFSQKFIHVPSKKVETR